MVSFNSIIWAGPALCNLDFVDVLLCIFGCSLCIFSARQHRPNSNDRDRPSVCLSVCLSHGWISQKRL